jgi:hypothetical protein
MIEPKTDLNLALLQHIQKSGSVIQLIDMMLKDDVFNDLSKPNPYFDSLYRVEAEKLDNLRLKLTAIEDRILEIKDCLTIDPYEGNL